MPRLGQGNHETIGDEAAEMGDHLPPVDLANHAARQVSAGHYHTCAVREDDAVFCWGENYFSQLGIGSSSKEHIQMGEALVPTELFIVMPGEMLEGLRLVGTGSSGILQMKYNGFWGLVCDDEWRDAAAQVACRQLGLAGGRAFSVAQPRDYRFQAAKAARAAIGPAATTTTTHKS